MSNQTHTQSTKPSGPCQGCALTVTLCFNRTTQNLFNKTHFIESCWGVIISMKYFVWNNRFASGISGMFPVVGKNSLPCFSIKRTTPGSHLYTKQTLKEACATSHAKVVIYKNKLGKRMCPPVRKLWSEGMNILETCEISYALIVPGFWVNLTSQKWKHWMCILD